MTTLPNKHFSGISHSVIYPLVIVDFKAPRKCTHLLTYLLTIQNSLQSAVLDNSR